MWNANLEDGSAVNGASKTWDDLGRDKKLTGVQLMHPHVPAVSIGLAGYDQYYYYKEAVAVMQGSQEPTVLAEILGGIDHSLGILVEIRLTYTGSLRVRTRSSEKLGVSTKVLREGKPDDKSTPAPFVGNGTLHNAQA